MIRIKGKLADQSITSYTAEIDITEADLAKQLSHLQVLDIMRCQTDPQEQEKTDMGGCDGKGKLKEQGKQEELCSCNGQADQNGICCLCLQYKPITPKPEEFEEIREFPKGDLLSRVNALIRNQQKIIKLLAEKGLAK